MTKEFIATPRLTKNILRKHDFSFKKSLGQNFIIDVNILQKVIFNTNITSSSGVIEIGPGIGSLTEQLAIHSKKVVAYEIDQRLLPILEDTLAAYANIEVLHGDILKVDLQETIEKYFAEVQDVHIVANLPYYITTPILMNVLQQNVNIASITVMLQKEVAQRMSALPNTKAYGSLSIAVQYYTEATIIMDVPKTAFTPQPNVISSVLNLTKRTKPPVDVADEDHFFSIVQACFIHRRKTLRNNLISYFNNRYEKEEIDTMLKAAGIDGTRRGESLSMEEFAALSNVIVVQ